MKVLPAVQGSFELGGEKVPAWNAIFIGTTVVPQETLSAVCIERDLKLLLLHRLNTSCQCRGMRRP